MIVLFESLDWAIINGQVLTHARDMRAAAIIDLEVWCFAWNGDSYRSSLQRRETAANVAGGPVRVFRAVRPAVPFSCVLNARLLRRAMKRNAPERDLSNPDARYNHRDQR